MIVRCLFLLLFLDEWPRFFACGKCTAPSCQHLLFVIHGFEKIAAAFPRPTSRQPDSDCLSVLDREPHVVEVCGAFSVLHSHSRHTPNTHTIHVAADSAGCRPSGACPGPSANQSASCLSSVRSEGNPTTSAFAADRLSSSSWIHIVHCCLPSPSAAMVCLPRLVRSFLNALGQAMPIQMEMEAPTLPILSLLLNSKARSCFFRL